MPIKKTKKKVVKKPQAKKTIKKVVKKSTQPTIKDIVYSWEIISLVTRQDDSIEQIIYELHGSVGKYKKKRTAIAQAAFAVIFDPKDKISTSDYRSLQKNEVIKYLKSKISENYLLTLKEIVQEQLFSKTPKVVTEISWK